MKNIGNFELLVAEIAFLLEYCITKSQSLVQLCPVSKVDKIT